MKKVEFIVNETGNLHGKLGILGFWDLGFFFCWMSGGYGSS